jgi:ABC-type phosphate transport system substrate-binding protein
MKTRQFLRAAIAAAVALGSGALAPALQDEPAETAPGGAYLVVVHPRVEGTAVSITTLRALFLREVDRWGDGTPVVPVDQSLQSPVRERFSTDVLGKNSREALGYWRMQISAGVHPPQVKETDADVLRFVAETEGAIGYVSPDADVSGAAVRVLTVTAAAGS